MDRNDGRTTFRYSSKIATGSWRATLGSSCTEVGDLRAAILSGTDVDAGRTSHMLAKSAPACLLQGLSNAAS